MVNTALHRQALGRFVQISFRLNFGSDPIISPMSVSLEHECLLVEVDADELWTTSQLHGALALFQVRR